MAARGPPQWQRNELEGMLHDAAGHLSAAHVAALVAHLEAVCSALAAAETVRCASWETLGRNRFARRRRRELPRADAESALVVSIA